MAQQHFPANHEMEIVLLALQVFQKAVRGALVNAGQIADRLQP